LLPKPRQPRPQLSDDAATMSDDFADVVSMSRRRR